VVLFGLSMDYHVFILSRVRELVDRGVPTNDAVARGIKATAGTVTSAAVVMVGVFAVFGSLRAIDLKQTGIGLAVAVLLDATIIRGVLLPATMVLLGDWNWYLPGWLAWLPSLGHGGKTVEAEAKPAAAQRLATGSCQPARAAKQRLGPPAGSSLGTRARQRLAGCGCQKFGRRR
jgi:putative drug exporter of the RND superfamily